MGDASARLSRFLTQSNHFGGGTVKHRAFMPPPDLQLSVYDTTGLENVDIWTLADHNIPGRPMYGRGDISAATVEAEGLRVHRDDTPPRHANITDWPAEKDAQKEIALALAAAAQLALR